MDRGVNIALVGGQYTTDRGSIYHGFGGQNTMGSGVDIPSVGGSKYHG